MNLTSEEKTLGMLCHLLTIFTGFLGTLIIWLLKKDQSEFVDKQGKQALNFIFSYMIYYAAAGVLCIVLIGLLLLPVLGIMQLVFAIMASVRAYSGEDWQYPLVIPFFK